MIRPMRNSEQLSLTKNLREIRCIAECIRERVAVVDAKAEALFAATREGGR